MRRRACRPARVSSADSSSASCAWLARELDHLRQGRPVLAPEVCQQLQAAPHRLQAIGILLEPLVPQPQLAGHVLDVCLGTAERAGKVGEGWVSAEASQGRSEQVCDPRAGLGQRGIGADKSLAGRGHGDPERSDLCQQ